VRVKEELKFLHKEKEMLKEWNKYAKTGYRRAKNGNL
jgi:hypothetical protein